jgi:rod shape-determining protein MreD
MDGIGRTPGIRPRPTLGRRLDALARASFPAACTVLLMLLAAAPFGLPMQAALLPALTFGSVWFWALFRPRALPPPLVFLIGALFDLLAYVPLGVGVLTLLIIYGVALRTRRVLTRQAFVVIWLAYAPVAAGAVLLGWAAASLLQYRLLPAPPALFELALCIAVYPALAAAYARAHGGVADPELA